MVVVEPINLTTFMFNFSYTRLTSVVAWILLIIFSSTIGACSRKKKRINFYPSEYRFPDSSIGNGKTFIYRNLKDTNNLRFDDFKIITEGKRDYMLVRQYSRKSTIDSAKYALDGQLIESYIFMPDTPVYKLKGVIIKNEIIDDGSRLGKGISIIEFKAYEHNVITIRGEEYFLKDTVINWKGHMLDCIKTRQTIWIKWENNRDSTTENTEKVSEGYFAKGIGLIRYSGNFQGRSDTMELSEIRDMSAAK